MLLPIVILTILKGSPWQFALLISIIAIIGLYEFFAMAFPTRKAEMFPFALYGGLTVFAPLLPDGRFLVMMVALALLLSAFHFLYHLHDITETARNASLVATSFLYIPFLLAHLVMLRLQPYGISWLFLIMLIIMLNDTFAYYFGSAFGKHKLYPAVSPNKSIEGSIAGLFGGLLGAAMAKYSFFPQSGFTDLLAVALLIGVVGQIGDLFESMLKRSFGVKDSGKIIPGHGGILDRMDSILFAAPVAYYYSCYIFGRF